VITAPTHPRRRAAKPLHPVRNIRGKFYPLFFLFLGGSFNPVRSLKAMPLSEQFQLFRSSHPVAHHLAGGHDWSYVSAGTGESTVVILPGGGGCDAIGAVSMFPVVAGLEQHFRVIAIGYPSTATKVDDLVEGLGAVLDDAGVRHAVLLGHSLGGFVAQAFAQKYPDRMAALLIANCAFYSPGRTLLLKLTLPLLARLPRTLLMGSIHAKFKRLLQGDPGREFWLNFLTHAEAADPHSPALGNQLRCMRDFVRRGRLMPAKAGGWTGRVLILESDEETGFTARERRDFRALYPGATVHVFPHAGHLSWATHTGEFVGAVTDFLAAGKK